MNKDYKINELESFNFEDLNFIGKEAQNQQEQFKKTVLEQVEKVVAAKGKELADMKSMYEELGEKLQEVKVQKDQALEGYQKIQ